MKAAILLFRYYLRAGLRRITGYFPLILVAGTVVFVILVYRPAPSPLSLVGYVVTTDAGGKTVPVPRAGVAIGGFRTTTDDTGFFSLTFSSPILSDIPLVLSRNGQLQVISLDVPEGQNPPRTLVWR